MRIFHIALSALALFIGLLTFPTIIHAQEEVTYEVTTDNLNVRSAADPQAKVVGQLHTGDSITTFKEDHGWMLTYFNGEEAWIASHHLVPTKQAESSKQSEETKKQITIIEDAVHVRSSPGLDQAIYDVVQSGDTFTLLNTENDWHEIQFNDTTTAWVASWLTDKPVETKQSENNQEEKAKTKATSNTSGQALSGYTIMLDPSHGGKDPGSIGIDGIQEKDIALDYTKIVADKLQEKGATVLLTRSTDKFVSLKDRVRISESYATDAFVSLHFNAFTSSVPNGISTHYYDINEDHQLAQHVQSALQNHTSLHDRGVRQNNYHVLRKNRDTSVLVELGFITNPSDVEKIQNEDHISSVATAITEGLEQYFN